PGPRGRGARAGDLRRRPDAPFSAGHGKDRVGRSPVPAAAADRQVVVHRRGARVANRPRDPGAGIVGYAGRRCTAARLRRGHARHLYVGRRHRGTWSPGFTEVISDHQYSQKTSPPLRVPSPRHTSRLMLLLTARAEPSISKTFTTPLW